MAKKILMGLREYSRHRGVALLAVQDAINNGRIEDAIVMKGQRRMIDQELADKLWIENADPGRLAREAQRKAVTGEGDSGDQPSISKTYQTNRAIRESYAARMAKLEFEKKSGQLLEKEKVVLLISKLHGRARDSLLNLPDKLGPKLAAENDIHKIVEIINKEIENVCKQFSNGNIEL